jgi:hypothetical protein
VPGTWFAPAANSTSSLAIARFAAGSNARRATGGGDEHAATRTRSLHTPRTLPSGDPGPYGIARANNSETYTGASGRQRKPDFFSNETIRKYNRVFEVKNKAVVRDERGGQVTDAALFGVQRGAAGATVFVRPGADTRPIQGIANVEIREIPQLPLITGGTGAGRRDGTK